MLSIVPFDHLSGKEFTMHRRDFLAMLGLLGLGTALPLDPRQAFAASASPAPLPIPGLLRPDESGRIALTVTAGQSMWKQAPTPTWGYNGPLLGPALSLKRGRTASLEVRNTLPEATTVHWHGLEIPGISDGGPQAVIASGTVWQAELAIKQRAATCWYHPHLHARTGRQVAMGLAGLLLIEDEESGRLPLPRAWGVDDIPLVLQDKRLDAQGRIAYEMDVVSAAVGWFGDFPLANGALYPQHAPPRGWLRLRLLNGCNARSLRLACSDNRPLYVIAGDGGFLPEPVRMRELTLYMGERFEVMLDVSDGKPFDLISLPVKQMGMALPPFDKALPVLRIAPGSGKSPKTRLPDRLAELPALPALDKLPVRRFQLSMDPRLDMRGMMELRKRYGDKAMSGMDMMGMGHSGGGMGGGMMHGSGGGMMHGSGGGMGGMGGGSQQPFDLWHSNFINNKAFVMNEAAFDVTLGRYERWVISGKGDMMLHPFHIHGTQFRILKENDAPPLPHRQGPKDIVLVEGKESEVLVRFDHPASAERMYMAHCHLLEHEDTGMMLAFTVTP